MASTSLFAGSSKVIHHDPGRHAAPIKEHRVFWIRFVFGKIPLRNQGLQLGAKIRRTKIFVNIGTWL